MEILTLSINNVRTAVIAQEYPSHAKIDADIYLSRNNHGSLSIALASECWNSNVNFVQFEYVQEFKGILDLSVNDTDMRDINFVSITIIWGRGGGQEGGRGGSQAIQ